MRLRPAALYAGPFERFLASSYSFSAAHNLRRHRQFRRIVSPSGLLRPRGQSTLTLESRD